MARLYTSEINETACIGDSLNDPGGINPNFLNLDESVQSLSSTIDAFNVVDTSTVDLTYSSSTRSLTATVKDNSIDYTKVAPGMVLDCVNVFTSTVASYGGTANVESEIVALSSVITPKLTTSKILIQAMINGEGHHDAVFRLRRFVGGVDQSPSLGLGSAAAAGSRNTGIAPVPYDVDISTTMSCSYIQFYDTPNTINPVTYRFYYRPSGSTTFNLNRAVNDTDNPWVERASSSVTLLEIKG